MAQENYNTFDFTPYESNFATGRREELADRTAQEFYTNKAEYDITQRALGALEVTNNDKQYVDALTAGVNSDMEGVLKTGRFDLGTYAVSDAVTRVMTDNKVKNSVETFAKRKEEDTRVAANPNEYKTYYNVPKMVHPDGTPFTAADYKDPNKRQFGGAEFDTNGNPIMIDLRDQWDSGVQGAYLGDSDKTLDHQARAYTMMSHIANNTVFIKNMIKAYKDEGMDIDAETAKKFIMSGQAITQGKVEGLAEKLLEMYSRTPEGQQRAKVLGLELSPTDREIPDVTGMGMSRSISQLNNDQEIQAALLNDLVTAGQTQIGMNISYSGIPQASGNTIINTPGINVDTHSTAVTSGVAEVDDDEWTQLFPNDQVRQTGLKKEDADMGWMEWAIDAIDISGTAGTGYTTAAKALKRVEEKLAKYDGDMNAVQGDLAGKVLWLQKTYKDKIPQLDGESNRDYAKRLYDGVLRGPMAQINRTYVMPFEGAARQKEILAAGANDLKIVSLDTDLDSFGDTPLTLKEFDEQTDRTGIDADYIKQLPLALAGIDPTKNGSVSISGVYPKGKLAGGTKITYTDSDGRVHNLVVALTDKPLNQWKQIGAMGDIIATGVDGRSKTIDVPIMKSQVIVGGPEIVYNKIKYQNDYIADASGNITHTILVTYIDSRKNPPTKTQTRFNPNVLGEVIKGSIQVSHAKGDTQGTLFTQQKFKSNTTL
tara:strand:- start:3176 stop:5305 length:2130 start_codon:yes stop_codon:yes gene_type:complete